MSFSLSRRLGAIGLMGVAVMTAACHNNSTAPTNHVDLTGTFGISSYTVGGNQRTIDAGDTAIFVFTNTKYRLTGTGNYTSLSDSGTYVATDSATVDSVLTGEYNTVSEELGSLYDIVNGSFRFSADQDTLTIGYNVETTRHTAVFVRSQPQ